MEEDKTPKPNKIDSIIEVLKSKSKGLDPSAVVSFEVKDISNLISDLESLQKLESKDKEEDKADDKKEEDEPEEGKEEGKSETEIGEDKADDKKESKDANTSEDKTDDKASESGEDKKVDENPEDKSEEDSKSESEADKKEETAEEDEEESKFAEGIVKSDLPKHRRIEVGEADEGFMVECYQTNQKIVAKDLDEVTGALKKILGTKISKFEETIEEEESKFQQAVNVCGQYKAQLEEKKEEMSKMESKLTDLTSGNKTLQEEISKFKKDSFDKMLTSTVEKVSKFKGLSAGQSAKLKEDYMVSKMSESALEELGRKTENEMFSKLGEPQATTKPTELLTPGERETNVSKMSSEDKLDALANLNAELRGFVQ